MNKHVMALIRHKIVQLLSKFVALVLIRLHLLNWMELTKLGRRETMELHINFCCCWRITSFTACQLSNIERAEATGNGHHRLEILCLSRHCRVFSVDPIQRISLSFRMRRGVNASLRDSNKFSCRIHSNLPEGHISCVWFSILVIL